jgi:outer membrane receptor for Fe3+-dicitrate
LNNGDQLSFTGTYFESSWDASGQIPQRAVDDGTISRFGAIDDTEGGQTSRTNILLEFTKNIDRNTFIKNTAYYNSYDFELYSNFTFFLEDSLNGDQIKQKEERDLFGFTSEYNQAFNIGNKAASAQLGVGFRNDQTFGSELSHTKNRLTTIDSIQLGDINETNSFAYAAFDIELGKLTINPGIRFDYFQFNYYDKLQPTYDTQSEIEPIVSPKLNFLYTFSSDVQLYLNSGKGFHSNDTRVVVPRNGSQILPAAYGSDFGVIWKPLPKMIVNAAAWYLYLEQEFVYVGDAGIVEPSGKTERRGIDLSVRYQAFNWLYADVDVNYAYARSLEAEEGSDLIPLAPDLTVMGGLNAQFDNGIYGGLRLRYLDDRPANDDNSIVAEGYTVIDANLGYEWNNIGVGLKVQNLFDVDWNETQFATESRLQNEAEPVEEIHFTPGTPFFATAVVSYSF